MRRLIGLAALFLAIACSPGAPSYRLVLPGEGEH